MTTGIKGNGKKGRTEWAAKEYNKTFSKLFDAKKVEEVQDVDLEDKEAYDDLDRIIDRVREAKMRLRGHLSKRGPHENSGV